MEGERLKVKPPRLMRAELCIHLPYLSHLNSTIANRQYPYSQVPPVMNTSEQEQKKGTSDKCEMNYFYRSGSFISLIISPSPSATEQELPLHEFSHPALIFSPFLLFFFLSFSLCLPVSFYLCVWWNVLWSECLWRVSLNSPDQMKKCLVCKMLRSI